MSGFSDFLSAIAPTVATAVAGPLGGMAVSAIGGILGIDKPTQKSIETAFTAGQITPDHIAAIKELELKYQNDEKERGFKYSELVYKDVDSARKLGIAMGSETPTILSYIILIGGGILLGCVVGGAIKTTVDNAAMIGTVIGYVVSEMKQVLTYWFGSSQGSVDNRNALIDMAKSTTAGTGN